MKKLSLICYHFWNKVNLNYLTQIKKQSSTNRLWFIAMSYVILWFICLSICFSNMLNMASSDSLVDKLTLISYLNDWLVLDDKLCEPSTSSNRINLSSSLNNNVCIVFFWYGEIIIIIFPELKNRITDYHKSEIINYHKPNCQVKLWHHS